MLQKFLGSEHGRSGDSAHFRTVHFPGQVASGSSVPVCPGGWRPVWHGVSLDGKVETGPRSGLCSAVVSLGAVSLVLYLKS